MTAPTLATRLLDRADTLLAGDPAACPTALRHRAAAFLARQALEELLDQLWRRRAPGLENASVRAQLACVPQFVRDDDLVARVRWAWGELTSDCHAGGSRVVDAQHVAEQVQHLRALAADRALAAGKEGTS